MRRKASFGYLLCFFDGRRSPARPSRPSEVAGVARRCVRVKGEERPTMKEVAHELAGLKAMPKHPWSESKLMGEEAEYLLGVGDLNGTYDDGATSSLMGCNSINSKFTFELDGAR
ncbi:hypothetical protein V6N13_047903 [Hibiscus sabdariffa]|uniref:Uncharacterized protein n=1 Tax=Hibiscus sabdariffa TaxID=183260 RepID=A0ABR2F5N7_9ROSI